MQFFCFLILIPFFIQDLYPNYRLSSHDTQSLSLGEIHALNKETHNPAGLSFFKTMKAGLSVFNPFTMQELTTATIYFKHPNKRIDYGIRLSAFGYDDYKITALQSSFSKKLFPSFSIGVHFLYQKESSLLKENQENYFSSHLGCWYILNDRIQLAVLAENILSNNTINPFNCSLGSIYKPHADVSLFIEAGYTEKKNLSLSLGFEYYIVEQFIIRSGFQINPKTPSLGIGYLFHKWMLNAGFSFHSILGISSSIGISFHL
ncbi:MAG: hypothetical protein LIO93_00660 [Bacteroidales bacterium]|nr:hypothetical protein [Bacteroidales bacterium]